MPGKNAWTRFLDRRNAPPASPLPLYDDVTAPVLQGSQAVALHPFEVIANFSDAHPSVSSMSGQELTDAMPQMVWSARADGHHDYFNLQWYNFTGAQRGSTYGEGWYGMFHADDRERARTAWQHSVETGSLYEIEYRLLHHVDGYRWTLGRALPVRRDDADAGIIRWIGTCTDINDRKLGEERCELLAAEMSHRIKNLFAIISALISMDARATDSAADLTTSVQSKIAALAAAHSMVDKSAREAAATGDATLHTILAKILEPYQAIGHSRIVLGGDDHRVGSEAATSLALIFHELATNAVKYGALSVPAGRIEIVTDVVGAHVQVHWQERGGPASQPEPTRSGFGSRLTETTLAKQLNGSFERRWEPEGLSVRVRIDRRKLDRASN